MNDSSLFEHVSIFSGFSDIFTEMFFIEIKFYTGDMNLQETTE